MTNVELLTLAREAATCTRCNLSKTRTQVVFGAGAGSADLMLVGEAPGATEDTKGIPFAGASGRVLAELLDGIGRTVDDVFITNALLCRPPLNRDPQPAEITACSSYLIRVAAIVKPRVIATLGAFPSKLVGGQAAGISRAHGKEIEIRIGTRLVLVYPLFDPALALHVPAMRRVLVKDFARIPELLERELDDPYENVGDEEGQPQQLGLFTTARAYDGEAA